MNAYNLAIALSVMGYLECEEMDGWKPIATAPKDGSVVEITALEENGEVFEIWPMQWGHIQQNGLFEGVVGMWVTPNGGMTWNDHPTLGGGPTHWREMK